MSQSANARSAEKVVSQAGLEKPVTRNLLKQAHTHMPMGVADSYRYWGEDNTVFVKSSEGCTITDADDQTFVDFRLAYGPIILGYRDARVDQEVIKGDNRTRHDVGFFDGSRF